MAQDKWPFPPQVLDHQLFGSQSTTSTTGVDLWGGGTTKPMGLGPGLIVIPTHFIASHSQANRRVDFRLQVSADGAAWTNADPGTGFPWYNNQMDIANQARFIEITFHYLKTGHAQEYVKIQWKTDAGTVSLANFAADGWASFVKMFKHPTWAAP